MTNYSGDFQRRNWVLAGHFAQNHFWRLMSEVGSKTDMTASTCDVRFTPESGL
jgi:hypothetical protein